MVKLVRPALLKHIGEQNENLLKRRIYTVIFRVAVAVAAAAAAVVVVVVVVHQ